MGKKIAIVAPMAVDLSEELYRDITGKIFVKNAKKLKEPDTEIDFFLMQKGFAGIDEFAWDALNAWNSFEIYEAVRGLKGKGYDAIVVHCYWDPYIYPLRQYMDIPVIGVAQNSLMFANMMGRKVGLITFSKYAIPIVEELVIKYGFKDSVVSIRSTETTTDDFLQGFIDASPIIDRFKDVARECIKDGAEVLVPG